MMGNASLKEMQRLYYFGIDIAVRALWEHSSSREATT